MNTHEWHENRIHYATLAGDYDAADEARAELAEHLAADRLATEDDCVCDAEGY